MWRSATTSGFKCDGYRARFARVITKLGFKFNPYHIFHILFSCYLRHIQMMLSILSSQKCRTTHFYCPMFCTLICFCLVIIIKCYTSIYTWSAWTTAGLTLVVSSISALKVSSSNKTNWGFWVPNIQKWMKLKGAFLTRSKHYSKLKK